VTPVVPLCTQHTAVAPKTWVLACGDGNYWLAGLRWHWWGGASATARGTAHQNDCRPYCAAGHFHASAVTVTVSGTLRCGTRRQYATLVVDYAPAAKPRVVERLGCRFP
jgi:hypothetical protein